MPEYQQQEQPQQPQDLCPTSHKQHLCAACFCPIQDRFFLRAADNMWHSRCLKCAVCKMSLEEEQSCFSKHGFIYCKEDYLRYFGTKNCARCGLTIDSSELVMRIQTFVYHLACFSCASCDKILNPGEYYGICDDNLYCQDDYNILQHNVLAACNFLVMSSAPPLQNSTCQVLTELGIIQQKRRSKKKQSESMCEQNDNQFDCDSAEQCTETSPQQHKRMRTSFKHNQLRTMKAYFGLNHNPDAKDLKQLAEKTGLPKRVLQVWFQNARAKNRRNLTRKEGIDSSEEMKKTTTTTPTEEGALKYTVNSLCATQSPALSDTSSTAISMLELSSSQQDSDSEEASNVAAVQAHKKKRKDTTTTWTSQQQQQQQVSSVIIGL